MNVTLRFYWQHDLDLLTLAEDARLKNISLLCKEALSAYVRGEEYEILVPEDLKKTTIDSKSTSFYLDPTNDADIIDFLTDIRVGFRCNAIKQITRSYISQVFMLPYLSDLVKVKSRGHAVQRKKPKSPKKEPVKQTQPVIPTQEIPEVPMPNQIQEENKEENNDTSGSFNVFDMIGAM